MLGIVLLGLLLCASPASAANVVLVVLDDGPVNDTRVMPTLAQMAREGATFTRAYTPTPICVPSRATIQTGWYRKRHGVYSNGYTAFVSNGSINKTFPVALKNAGVRTSLVGKYLNGAPSTVPGWSSFMPHVGGGLYYSYKLRVNGTAVSYGTAPADYSTDVFRARFLTQIRDAVSASRPFFAMLAVGAPHTPSTPAPRHTNVSGLTNRERTLLAVDEALKAVIDTLRTTGQLDKTYIVFTSDHGLSGRSGSKPKGVPYEGSIRVPLVVKGPGVPAGSTRSHITNLADLAPTFLDWLGVPARDVDGRSFARLVTGSPPTPQNWRRATPIAHSATDSAPDVPSWKGVRTTRYAYFKFEGRAAELYDVAADPNQQKNLAPGNPTLTTKLATLADDLANCTSARCREIENRPVD